MIIITPQNPGDPRGIKFHSPKPRGTKKYIPHIPHSHENEIWSGIANPSNNIAKFLCSQESVFVRLVGQDQIVTNVSLIGIVLKKAQKIVMHPMTAFVLVLLITSYAMKL